MVARHLSFQPALKSENIGELLRRRWSYSLPASIYTRCPKKSRGSSMGRATIIAVIDDDASVGEATGSLLRSCGYCIRIFSSAEQFLASGVIEKASCVITDV